jgi:hypothetical protein
MRSGNTIKIINNQQGIALVSALVFGVIGMLMVASLLLMVDSGTWLSGSKKRYHMALSATHGGMDFFTKEVIQSGLGGTTLGAMNPFGGLLITNPAITDANFTTKLTTRGDSTDGFWPYDPNLVNTGNAFVIPDATVSFVFPGGAGNINVATTILSTNRGNSGLAANVLQGGGVVNNGGNAIAPQHIPYLYQTVSQGQSAVNARENARLSAIYAY